MKKLLLSLGTIGAVITPVAAMVSCSKEVNASAIVDLGSKDLKTKKYQNIIITLDYGFGQIGNFLDAAIDIIQKNKSDISGDANVKLTTEAGSKETTYNDLKSLTLPSELINIKEDKKDKTKEHIKYIEDVFNALKAEFSK